METKHVKREKKGKTRNWQYKRDNGDEIGCKVGGHPQNHQNVEEPSRKKKLVAVTGKNRITMLEM
jgi:hypothetical protein